MFKKNFFPVIIWLFMMVDPWMPRLYTWQQERNQLRFWVEQMLSLYTTFTLIWSLTSRKHRLITLTSYLKLTVSQCCNNFLSYRIIRASAPILLTSIQSNLPISCSTDDHESGPGWFFHRFRS